MLLVNHVEGTALKMRQLGSTSTKGHPIVQTSTCPLETVHSDCYRTARAISLDIHSNCTQATVALGQQGFSAFGLMSMYSTRCGDARYAILQILQDGLQRTLKSRYDFFSTFNNNAL